MEEATPSQPFAAEPRHALNQFSAFHTPQAQQANVTFASQLDPNLQVLDSGDAFNQHFQTQLENTHETHIHVSNPYHGDPPPRFQEIRSHTAPPRRRQGQAAKSAGQFGVLTPHAQLVQQPDYLQHNALGRTQQENDTFQLTSPVSGQEKKDGHFANMKSVPNPPDLQAWRERLFHVDNTMTLSEDDFLTYFPHVDNIYSHRSTQRYKRKPFVSHYWDCRLKGRPPGTPKSDDPNKRKRKRQARERDLCDVKIKITEYFPGARATLGQELSGGAEDSSDNFFGTGEPFATPLQTAQQSQPYASMTSTNGSVPFPGSNGERFFTIQRVNGNGGNGKGDGVAGPHKHALADSDRVKKNSIQRQFLKDEKETKKIQKTYHKKATGAALSTARRHSKEHDLKLFGSCFCPFVQRVWIAMELKDMDYQYIEVDPYKKPESLLEINPLGLVPALRHGDWTCHESTVLMEYLEDVSIGTPLLPPNAQSRAHSRLWADHINRKIVPAFYHYLQAQDPTAQVEIALELKTQLTKLVDAAHPTGPFFLGSKISFVDVQFAPWLLRMRRVLKPYRGWPEPEEGSRWQAWVEAIEGDGAVRATTSGDDLYLDSYERYAENRLDTSQVANAVNAGRGLP